MVHVHGLAKNDSRLCYYFPRDQLDTNLNQRNIISLEYERLERVNR